MADLFQAAERYEQLGQFDEAIAAYGQMADMGVGAGEPLIRRALLSSNCGDIKGAVCELRRATTLDPGNPYVWMRLAHLEDGAGRRVVTVQHMSMACDAAPWNTEMRVNLAAAYRRANWSDLAYRVARTLPQDVPDWWAQVRQLSLEDYRGQRLEALDILRRRRATTMDHGWLYDMAKRLYRLGRLKLARRLCEKIIGENPQWFLPYWLVSDIIARQAGLEGALAYLNTSFRLQGDAPDYANADHLEAHTGLLNELGRFDEMLSLLNAQPDVQPREHFRQMAAIANFMTDRDQALRAHCLKWMRESPLSPVPAGFIVLMYAKQAAGRRRAEPRPSSVHIAQFWDKGAPPRDVQATMESWIRLHPNWRRTLFDGERARDLITARFGARTAQAYSHCYHAAMRADFFRVAYLLANGGLYADADEACLRPIGDILPEVGGCELLAPRAAGVPGFVDTPFLGARAGSHVLQIVLEDAVENILLAAQEGRRPTIWEVTGPGALTRGLAHYLASPKGEAGDGVFLLPIQQYRAYVQTQDLLYKRDAKMNWRIASAD